MNSNLKLVADSIKRRLSNDLDYICAVTGFEGSSKSTFAIHLGMLVDKNFDLNDNVIYENEEIFGKFEKIKKRSVLVLDEGMNIFYKRSWNSKFRKQLNILFSMARQKCLCVIICIPNIFDLDSYMLRHRIWNWIHCHERGSALIFKKDRNPLSTDPLLLEVNSKILKKQYNLKKHNPDRLWQKLNSLTNCMCSIHFKDLTPETKRRYLRIKRKAFLRYIKLVNSKNDESQDENFVNLLKFCVDEKGMRQREIAEALEMSQQNVSKILKGI